METRVKKVRHIFCFLHGELLALAVTLPNYDPVTYAGAPTPSRKQKNKMVPPLLLSQKQKKKGALSRNEQAGPFIISKKGSLLTCELPLVFTGTRNTQGDIRRELSPSSNKQTVRYNKKKKSYTSKDFHLDV